MLALVGAYFLRKALAFNNEISPYYLEITFIWSMIVLGLLTPLAIQRSRDIGISTRWVILLWLLPLSDLKFILIVNKYTDISISGKALWLTTVIALIGFVFLIMLFFSRSDDNANEKYTP